jgi:hypothetical protein
MFKKIPDSFHYGIISSLLLSFIAYLTINQFDATVNDALLKKYLGFPRLYFLMFLLQLIVLRIMMITHHKQHFGRGWMTGVFIFALFVFYLIKTSSS